MIGRHERARTNVHPARPAQLRATRAHALSPTGTILIITLFLAALLTRATGSSAALIGPWDAPAVSAPTRGPADAGPPTSQGAPAPGSASPSAKGTASALSATMVEPVPSSSPTEAMRQLPACQYADKPAAHAAYDEWQRTIVDTTIRLPKGYVPTDLVAVSRAGLSGGGAIRLIAIADLKALGAAGQATGVRLAIESAYRSETRQQRTYAAWVRASGEAEARRFSARAGHSEHQLGTAIDFKAAGGGSPWSQAFARSREALWLAANAWRFGWIQSYPPGAETQTCYGGEAWHYRYVGRDVAAHVHASGMTLRAWLWLNASAD